MCIHIYIYIYIHTDYVSFFLSSPLAGRKLFRLSQRWRLDYIYIYIYTYNNNNNNNNTTTQAQAIKLVPLAAYRPRRFV